jgi:hypothetical protein
MASAILALVPQSYLLQRLSQNPSDANLKVGGVIYPRATVVAQVSADGALNTSVYGLSAISGAPFPYITNISQVE